MSKVLDRMASQGPPGDRLIQNQPTSSDGTLTEEGGDADEPPDERKLAANPPFQKAAMAKQNRQSLLTQILHTSESDSQPDEDLVRSNTHRTQSSASTYSRGSVISMSELMSDGGHPTPPTQTPSPPLPPPVFHGITPTFNKVTFDSPQAPRIIQIDPMPPVDPLAITVEKTVESGLVRRRCITFACTNKEKPKAEEAAPKAPEAKRPCALKFACPTRASTMPAEGKPRRLASPPPPVHRASPAPTKEQKKRGSDATVQNISPKVAKRSSAMLKSRRDSDASDSSRPEAKRFHEFASSEEEIDDWTQESTCFQRRLTIDDTLEKENTLRRLGREVEDEENDEEAERDELDEMEEDDQLARSTGWVSSDDGFQSDDEQGFAHSDDDDDEDPEFQWWGQGTSSAAKDMPEFIRPSGPKVQRSDSVSSTGFCKPEIWYEAQEEVLSCGHAQARIARQHRLCLRYARRG